MRRLRILALCLVLALPGRSRADGGYGAGLDRAALITLARALVGEGGNAHDRRIIPHLLYRRWLYARRSRGWGFAELVTRYCSPLRRDLPLTWRRAWVRSLSWIDLPEDVRRVVSLFSRGRLPDPCPAAWHFDNRSSLRWVRLPRVCGHLPTQNVFYGRPR